MRALEGVRHWPGQDRAFEEGSQSRIVAFVEQAHGAGDGRLTGGGVDLTGKSETRQCVLEHAHVANANLPALKAGGMEHVDRQGEHFGFSQRPRCPDEFHTVLEELAVAAGLEFLVPVALSVVRQTERLGVHAHLFGDHAHDGRREFRAQGQVALTLVLKRIELIDDARAGLGGEQLKRFKHGVWTLEKPWRWATSSSRCSSANRRFIAAGVKSRVPRGRCTMKLPVGRCS